MAVASRKKSKDQEVDRDATGHWTAEWAVEPSSTEGWVNVTLIVKQTDDVSTTQRTYRYQQRRERAKELIHELTEALKEVPVSENLDITTALIAAKDALQEEVTSSASSDENDSLRNHFALGAYGLVGN